MQILELENVKISVYGINGRMEGTERISKDRTIENAQSKQ